LKSSIGALVVASRNKDKLKEIVLLLEGMDINVRSLEDFPELVLPPETGETFRENALIKARCVLAGTGVSALGDDSGLEVDALQGRPGVRSSRFAGERVSYEDNTKKLLAMLSGVPREERKARFVCVLALCLPKGIELTFQGTCHGEILEAPRGTGGFGYDPVFFIPEKGKTMAELDPDEKNLISHRGKAFQAVKKWLLAERGLDSR